MLDCRAAAEPIQLEVVAVSGGARSEEPARTRLPRVLVSIFETLCMAETMRQGDRNEQQRGQRGSLREC